MGGDRGEPLRGIGARFRIVVLLFLAANLAPPVLAQNSSAAGMGDRTVVVVRFENLSRHPALEWFGAGIVETLRADLVGSGFSLIGSTRGAVAMPHDLQTVEDARVKFGREIGARWVITGAYQRFGPDLRVIANLTDAESGQELVFRRRGSRDALFDLQDQVVLELTARMSGRVPDATLRSTIGGLRGGGPLIDGPAAPVPPEVMTRGPDGRATVRAVRVAEALSTDGRLDEDVYEDVPAMSGFIQVEPVEGVPATEKTDVWVLFDDEQVYISIRCWDSAPESTWVVNEMRRDNLGIFDNESVSFFLDTFYDRRNGLFFMVNPIGGRMDAQVTNERNFNPDWNPVWDLQTGRFEGGWTVEASLPFKSLRYRPRETQVWGIQVRRIVRWKNEYSFLTPIPASVGLFGTFQASMAATLVGVEAPASTRTLEIKPYAIADVVTDRTTIPELSNELGGNVGLDVKYGVTRNLVADFTVNTDFAQVEADEQQVNLTRFSLFFPEKREFFLENQGLFAFGGAGTDVFGGGGISPILFYSREIGLDQGQVVPIDVGGRATGRVGSFSVGAMAIRSAESPVSDLPSTAFTVLRLKRDVLRRSSVGAMFTGRSASRLGSGSNEAYGVDGTFAFYDNLKVNTYWSQTQTPGLVAPGVEADETSYRAQLDYAGDRYGVQAERLVVGDHFNPEVGFLLRDDFERNFGVFRFSPRPQSIAAIRKLTWEGRFDYITTRANVLETRIAQGIFGIEFENSDRLDATYTRSYEFLQVPFAIAPGVTIPVGGYTFQDVELDYALGPHRLLSGRVSAQHGSFFGGDKSSLGFTRARLEVTQQLSVEPGVSLNWVSLPQGRFTTELVTARTTYTVTPQMFASALIQYNSSNATVGANVRLRWEYQPGSELFVVYNEQRETLTPRFPELENRSLVVKINRLFRF